MKDVCQIAIDQGNSFAKIGVFLNKKIVEFHRVSHEQTAETLCEIFDSKRLDAGIFSTVRAEKDQNILFEKLPFPMLKLTAATPIPLTIGYETPDTLGQDRIANACGAYSLFSEQPVLIVDSGSCITYTLVCDKKIWGGAISPGLNMRYASLHHFTGRLPFLQPDTTDTATKLTGTSTSASIHSGIINGITCEIDGMIARFLHQINALKIILTGGDASFFDGRLKSTTFAAPYLTLTGLHEILEYNQS